MDDKETPLAKLKGWEESGKAANSKWQRCHLEDVVDAQSFKYFERIVKELHANLYGEGRYE